MAQDLGFSNMQSYRITSLPETMYYMPNFITEAEEQQILQKLPPNRWTVLSHRRLQAHPSTLTANSTLLAAPLPPYLSTNPDLQSRFAQLGVFTGDNGFEGTPHKAPNHCLVNEYRRGEGIMMHEDGAAYARVVATVSLGASIVLDVVPKRDIEEGEELDQNGNSGGTNHVDAKEGHAEVRAQHVLCEPRSLLLTTGRAYVDTLHGIPAVEVDTDLGPETVANWTLLGDAQKYIDAGGRNERGTRVSLTYRDVLKVAKMGGIGKILGGGKR